jgi:hypothetical protein
MERFAIVANGLVGLALMITGAIYGVLGMTVCGVVVVVLVGIVALLYFKNNDDDALSAEG